MLSEAYLTQVEERIKVRYACNPKLADIIRIDLGWLLAEVKRLRPVVEAAQGWHTTRQDIAEADQLSGSEWFIQIGVAMREHQQAADKLAAVVAALAEKKGEQVG